MPTKATTAGGDNCFVNGEHDSLETMDTKITDAFANVLLRDGGSAE